MDGYLPMITLVLNGIVALFFFGNVFQAYIHARSSGADYNILNDLWIVGLSAVLSLGAWQGISMLG